MKVRREEKMVGRRRGRGRGFERPSSFLKDGFCSSDLRSVFFSFIAREETPLPLHERQ